jgi:hypothetical protein
MYCPRCQGKYKALYYGYLEMLFPISARINGDIGGSPEELTPNPAFRVEFFLSALYI